MLFKQVVLMKKLLQRILVKKQEGESNKLIAWIPDLADMGDIAALKLATQKIATLIDDDALSTHQKLDLIIKLEEINQPRLEKLASEFSALSNLKPELESSITETCYTYCRQSYIYHLKLLEVILDQKDFKVEDELLLLVMARAINTAFNMIKWRAFIQQNPPTKVWLQIYLLYKIAYRQNLLNQPIELFTLGAPTTLAAFIVQICMFGQLQQANLEKQHLQVTSKILRAWITHAHISTKHNTEQYLFYINLDQDLAAKRMRNFEPSNPCRYWELDDLEKQMTIAMTVSARGEFPNNLILSKIDDPKILHETLSVLHAEWTKNEYVRQRRTEDREATSRNAKVKAGVFEICDQVLHANQIRNGLKRSKQGKSLDDLLIGQSALNQSNSFTVNSGSLDTWIITDQSKHGLGARVNKYANTLARPKKLIGLVFDDDPTIVSVGIVRTVKATQGNQLRVGIEVISNLAIWTQLNPDEENSTFANSLANTNKGHLEVTAYANTSPGIYLPKEPGLNEQATIIIPKINFKLNTKYTIHFNGKTKRVEFDEPIESNDDWVKVAIDF